MTAGQEEQGRGIGGLRAAEMERLSRARPLSGAGGSAGPSAAAWTMLHSSQLPEEAPETVGQGWEWALGWGTEAPDFLWELLPLRLLTCLRRHVALGYQPPAAPLAPPPPSPVLLCPFLLHSLSLLPSSHPDFSGKGTGR